ncbi:MAG TPA: hypothetical protein VEF04_19190, partial [Blastocatellia bacterium]|nr:hypothetical protein [Blastocatellia bacterium]
MSLLTLPRSRAIAWLALFTAIGIALVFLYPDSYQQDGGYHFQHCRWAWKYPGMFVSVWGRPLFTFLYSFPAFISYDATRIFNVLISTATAWQTWRLAKDLKLARAEFVIPLLFLQPSFFILVPDLLTETLFALIFVIAIRLHLNGWIKVGMFVASLMILTRPEGFFLGALWGVWVLFDRRLTQAWWKRISSKLILASGALMWWLAAYLITGDALFIMHNWPREWHEGTYGRGFFGIYILRLPEIAGLLLSVPFIYGLVRLLRKSELVTLTSSFLLIFGLHSLFRTFGTFGDAGYPRYLVCVSPAIAIITLVGWEALSQSYQHYSMRTKTALTSAVLIVSAALCFLYMDGLVWIRDAHANREMYAWFRAHERPVARLVYSQVYMGVLFDHDPVAQPQLTLDREENLRRVGNYPRGT